MGEAEGEEEAVVVVITEEEVKRSYVITNCHDLQ